MNTALENFSQVSERFCNWAEGSSLLSENEITTAFTLLSELVTSILKTPDVGCGEDIEAPSVTQEEWEAIFNRFSSPSIRYYATYFTAYSLNEPQPVTGDLADDIADIYRDLKDGLWFYQNGHIKEASWSWRNSFQIHWGRHATSAMQAIHEWLVDQGLGL